MDDRNHPAGGSEDYTAGDLVELKLASSPEMIVIRSWLAAEITYDDSSSPDLGRKVRWCLCVWFDHNRSLCEHEFPAALLRRVPS